MLHFVRSDRISMVAASCRTTQEVREARAEMDHMPDSPRMNKQNVVRTGLGQPALTVVMIQLSQAMV